MDNRIGRYQVDQLLAKGGMAEVFLARAEGPAGFSKQVVIKRILPEFVEDERFVRMFLDEAKLAAVLNHPNIVQVFDFGEENGAYFIAMEYIEGESLRNVIRHFKHQGAPVDPRFAAYLVMGACEGLHYAHSLCDSNGVSYNIIHRDVSPDNVLVSATGIVKVVDFGIAKAAVNASKTEVGIVKGKYAYMSPELIRGEGVDRGVDVYALGVTLYELLTGRRPFEADNEMRLLHQILHSRPPRVDEVNPAVPETLAQVVHNAMDPDRDLRYPDARTFQAALEDYLLLVKPRVAVADVALLIKEVNAERKAREPGPASGPKAVPGFQPAGLNLPRRLEESKPDVRAPAAVSGPVTAVVPAPPPLEAEPPPKPPRPRWVLPAAVVGVMGLAAVIGVVAGRPKPAETPPVPPIAQPAARPDPAPTPAPPANPKPDPTPTPDPGVPPATPETPNPAPPATPQPDPKAVGPKRPVPANGVRTDPAGSGFLSVRSEPWCDVYLDGVRVGTTPINRLPVPAGARKVVLRNEGAGAQRELAVVIPADEEVKKAIVFPMGELVVRVQPWAHVQLDGKPIGTTPFAPVAVAAGAHEVRLTNPELGRDERRRVVIREGEQETVKIIWE